jgi:hypothetical protein
VSLLERLRRRGARLSPSEVARRKDRTSPGSPSSTWELGPRLKRLFWYDFDSVSRLAAARLIEPGDAFLDKRQLEVIVPGVARRASANDHFYGSGRWHVSRQQ